MTNNEKVIFRTPVNHLIFNINIMKRKILLTFTIFVLALNGKAQLLSKANQDESIPENLYFNLAEQLLRTDGKLKLGGYGEAHYNQPLSKDLKKNGTLDVHRFVMMLGYQFNSKTQFVTELEFEHVNEVSIEQMYLQYKLTNYLNFRAGLLLSPMSIINLYHEPTVFNGVERPQLNNALIPTTWREIGFGASGIILPAYIKYQVYVMNGFKSYDNGVAQIGGEKGLRNGRQKAAKSFVSSPNYTARLEFFGLRGFNIGLSGYFGKTQSALYDNIKKGDDAALSMADSSVVGLSMIGADARYSFEGFKFASQLFYSGLSNTYQYNAFTANKGGGDLGKSMFGYYADLGYNLLKTTQSSKEFVFFVRYSNYDTHFSVSQNIIKNSAYQKTVFTTGLSLFLDKGAVIKTDLQFVKSGSDTKYANTLNVGFGIMF